MAGGDIVSQIYSAIRSHCARYHFPLPVDPAYNREDLAQDAALRTLDVPIASEGVRQYAYRALYTAAVDRFKYRCRGKRGPELSAIEPPEAVTRETPEDLALRAELRSLWTTTARSLTGRWSEGLRLRVAEMTLEGWTHEEIAFRLGVHPRGVQKFLARLVEATRSRAIPTPTQAKGETP